MRRDEGLDGHAGTSLKASLSLSATLMRSVKYTAFACGSLVRSAPILETVPLISGACAVQRREAQTASCPTAT